MAATMPMMAITIMSSINVKPPADFRGSRGVRAWQNDGQGGIADLLKVKIDIMPRVSPA
jgi:hypothetical protein